MPGKARHNPLYITSMGDLHVGKNVAIRYFVNGDKGVAYWAEAKVKKMFTSEKGERVADVDWVK